MTNHFKRWTSKEDSDLKDAINAGYDVRETATLLGRTTASIHTRKSQLFSGSTRFPITGRKANTDRLHKFGEFSEDQQILIRRELLNTPREALCIKWSIDQRTVRQYPDSASDDTLRAQHAVVLFDTRQEAADHLRIGIRTLYRRLNNSSGEITIDGEIMELDHTEFVETPTVELNASALLVRDVVIALKPYGVSCSFEFDGDQVKTMKATFS